MPGPSTTSRRSGRVDLNADLGEEVTDDAALLEVVTSANVACGYHAGNVAIMREVCERAAAAGVALGAQVSYDDREHFGRVALDVPAALLRDQVADQVGTLADLAARAGTAVTYVKPHGALYHRVLDDAVQAGALLAGSGDLPVLGMSGVCLDLARRAGRSVFLEGFPDRAYRDGRLVPRDQPGALLETRADVVAQALRLAPDVASVCLHGDSPGAVAAAVAVRAALEDAGWSVAPFAPPPG